MSSNWRGKVISFHNGVFLKTNTCEVLNDLYKYWGLFYLKQMLVANSSACSVTRVQTICVCVHSYKRLDELVLGVGFLPVRQLGDLKQGQAGHTALGCPTGEGIPLLLLLPRPLTPPLSAELHAAPKTTGRNRRKSHSDSNSTLKTSQSNGSHLYIECVIVVNKP